MRQSGCFLAILVAGFFIYLPRTYCQDGRPAQARDPFIPLIDEKGGLRKIFQRPEGLALQLNLAGISKINHTYYAMIEGEWLQKGDRIKGALIEGIEAGRVILILEGKKFELLLEKPQE